MWGVESGQRLFAILFRDCERTADFRHFWRQKTLSWSGVTWFSGIGGGVPPLASRRFIAGWQRKPPIHPEDQKMWHRIVLMEARQPVHRVVLAARRAPVWALLHCLVYRAP